LKLPEGDSHSKVSTACTNDENRQKGKSVGKRKPNAKGKKGCKKVKEFGEGLDEETKSILDNQLDQLVIEKPAALIN